MKQNKGFGVLGLIIAFVLIIGVGAVAYNAGKKSSTNSAKDNPLYEEKDNKGDNPLYEGKSNQQAGDIPNPKVNQTKGEVCDKNSSPSITVLSPAGGETYTMGQKVTIQWTSCNVQNVNIGWAQGGHDKGSIKDILPASQGSYQWTVPSGHNESYTGFFIGVWDADPGHLGVLGKSGTFSIKNPYVTLPVSKYITPYPNQWPPTVQHSATVYSCTTISRDVSGSPMTLKGTPKTINGRTFCRYGFSDGGAGHFAGEYTYTTAELNGQGTERVDFRVDWPNCGVYGGSNDPQYIQCSTEQTNFFNSMDAAVASLM